MRVYTFPRRKLLAPSLQLTQSEGNIRHSADPHPHGQRLSVSHLARAPMGLRVTSPDGEQFCAPTPLSAKPRHFFAKPKFEFEHIVKINVKVTDGVIGQT